MLIGYARVSTENQNLDTQLDTLKEKGAERIFHDKVSGAKAERSGLKEMYNILRKGDIVLVTSLDRLGRSHKELVEIITKFQQEGVHLSSLRENIDTSTATGRLIFHIFCSLAEFERSLISERTIEGLKAARARGRVGGRKKALEEKDAELMQEMYDSRKYSIHQLAKKFNISKPTVYNYITTEKN